MTSDLTISILDNHVKFVGRDFDAWIDLFAEDAVLEFPYLVSLGMAGRIDGREAIRANLGPFLDSMANFHLTDVRVYAAADPDRVFAEYSVDATSKTTGRRYNQHYFAILETKGTKIVRMREYLDVVVAAKALLPNGMLDVPS